MTIRNYDINIKENREIDFKCEDTFYQVSYDIEDGVNIEKFEKFIFGYKKHKLWFYRYFDKIKIVVISLLIANYLAIILLSTIKS